MMMRDAFFESFFLLVLSVVGCRADGFHGLLRNLHARNSDLPVRGRGSPSGNEDDFVEAKDIAENHEIEEFLKGRLLMSQNMDMSPRTAAPNTAPSSPRNAPSNNKCNIAIMLATEGNIAGIPGDGTFVVGTTVDAIYDEASFSCDYGTSHSPALWYAVRGTGETMRADTCSNYTDFDTVISILKGPCGITKSTCLGSNDDSCGSLSSSVIWPTELGVDYYIRVAGRTDGLVGEFGLRVSTYEVAPNDDCSGAIELTKGGNHNASMVGASPGDSSDCFYDDSSAGIWYYVDGRGTALSISTCDQAGKGTFSGRIQVFLGSTSSLSGLECMPFAFSNDCSSSSTGSVKFFAEEGERYSILFLGPWDEGSDDNHNFTITVTDFEPAKQNRCEGAVRMDNSSHVMIVSTEDSLPEDTPCNQVLSSAGASPSVWYTVQGTGRTMMASTCSSELTMDTSLNVLSGSCNQLSCVAHGTYNHDVTCEATSFGSTQVVFQTEVDTAYYVLVTGTPSSEDGDSILTISDVDVPWNDRDTNATMIIPNTGTIIGSTRNASGPVFRSDISNITETSCAFNPDSPGVWYSLNGTDQGYVLSTCSNETTFETAISVSFDTCGGMECMMIAANNDNSCSSGIRSASAVIWAEMGVEYLIFVHGASENTRGDFGLTVSSFDFVPNDLCTGALTVLPDNGTIFGSTFEATDSGTLGCSSAGMSGTKLDVKSTINNTDTDDDDFDYDYAYDFDYDNDDTVDNDKVNNRVFVNDTDTRGNNLTRSVMDQGPDLWYRVDGTGGLLTVSTMGDNKTYVSQIKVMESENGTCTTLSCVVVNNDPMGVDSQVEWWAELGMTYFVRVLGYTENRGPFELSLTTP